MIHALGDGRPGVLVVARQSAGAQAERAAEDILAAFDVLPSAAVLVARDGSIRHLNAAALLLLAAGQRASLAGLLGETQAAEDMLARVEAAGTIVSVRSMPVRLGQRDIKLTARLLNRAADSTAFAMVLLDDVTERRALELKLSEAQAPSAAARAPEAAPAPLSADDAAAFEKLGKTLEDGIRHVPRRDAAPETAVHVSPPPGAVPQPIAEVAAAVPAPPPRRKLQRLPDQVRVPLESRAEPLLIAKDGQLLFANTAAARFFGYESGEDVINDNALFDRFGQLGQSLPGCDISLANGHSIFATVKMSVVPWLGGPARQFILKQAEPPTTDAAELKLAPAPAEANEVQHAPAPTLAPAGETEAVPVGQAPQKVSAEVIQLAPRISASEADQELRAILDTAADGIITLDANARIHTFSAGAEAIFGYRIADVAGKPFIDLLAPESRKVVRDYLAALQGPGLASVFNDGREVTAVVSQGGTVPLFLTIGKLQATRSQAAFCAVVRDITQWKKTETELREAKERAEATSRQKSEFLASVSHELRTPLNAIMGFSEVMRLGRFGEIDNEKYRGYVHDIHSSGSHLLSLINDLLDLSKVEAGKLELNFTSVNLGEVADHTLKMLQEQATAARVVLRKSIPAELPNVVADLRSMRQIMLNLMSNAIKFTDPGGQVAVSAQVMPGGELKLRIKDTGIGMSADQLKGALQPFGRVVTEGRDVQGTGLGLPLTRALTEANRATFELSSEPRKGTLAEITFPTTRVLAD
jgi:PAS domain S-box-containing protein